METKKSRDPAFLFYDGDAARDVSHMNRLERGCYFDIIQAQRKFGKMKIDLVKKILGKDFDACWDTIKICLTYENDMYYIAWLQLSTIKRLEYSESRRKNRLHIKHVTYVNHMENENENENEIKDIKEKANSILTHFNHACNKNLTLTTERKRIINKCLKAKRTVEQLKTAIANFSKDDWPERHKYCDIIYAIGTIRGIDNFDKWFNYQPPPKRIA